MKVRIVPIFSIVLGVLLAASSVVFYLSSASEHRMRVQKEAELQQKQKDLTQLQTQITELNDALASLKDTSSKRINALEMTARQREQTARSFREELEILKKEKELWLRDSLEKASAISDLTGRLTVLQKDKEGLAKKVEELKNQLSQAQQKADTVSESESAEMETDASQPFGMADDPDLGAKIDSVNLGEIVVSKSSGRAARVQEVNAIYDFVILDVGQKDGIREGSVMNIVRHNSLIGKAVVRHVRAGASAALILPEWKKAPIEKGDLITKF